MGSTLYATLYQVVCASFDSVNSSQKSTFEMKMHCHPNSERYTVPATAQRQSTWYTAPGSQEWVLTKLRQEAFCPWQLMPCPPMGGAEGFQQEYFYDDWMGPVGFRVEDSNSIPGNLILHAGAG